MKHALILIMNLLALVISLWTSGASAQETDLLGARFSSGYAAYKANINLAVPASATYAYRGGSVFYAMPEGHDAALLVDLTARASSDGATWNADQNGWAASLPFQRRELVLSVGKTSRLGHMRFEINGEDTRFGAGQLSLSSVGYSIDVGLKYSIGEGTFGAVGMNLGLDKKRFSTITNQSGAQWSAGWHADRVDGFHVGTSFVYSFTRNIALSYDIRYRFINMNYSMDSGSAPSFSSNESVMLKSVSLTGQF